MAQCNLKTKSLAKSTHTEFTFETVLKHCWCFNAYEKSYKGSIHCKDIHILA
jgi:hypothetical protein